jgi:DNA helicase-2/ATP-dependent DNA helicase PcrA
MDRTTLLTGLNEQQQAAVLHADGPAMVLAGAGSGKTKVLTTRAALLLAETDIRPDQILLLTFTNKAAGEMNERVRRLSGQFLPFSGTFHRICCRILRVQAEKVGLKTNFVIYDADDQLSLVKLIARDFDLDSKQYHPRALLSAIGDAKQQLLSADEYRQFARGQFQEIAARVFVEYERRLRAAGAVDFDNLLVLAVQLFRQYPEVIKQYQEQFVHVLVDEYQDVNHAQYVLTKFLAFPQNNLFVVGDASQAIYGWRGADYHNLLKLKQDFVHIAEYRLERNYRSTNNILAAATGVIHHNTLHPVLDLWTDNNTNHKIVVLENRDGTEEARVVTQKIQQLVAAGESLSEIAILYRTNAQSREFEEAFMLAGMPYRLVGGVQFYARKEIKDILAYLSYFLQPTNEVAAHRLLKIGKRQFALFQTWVTVQQADPHWLQQATNDRIAAILDVTSYAKKLDANDPADLTRLENIQELQSAAVAFPNLVEFMEQVALVENDQLKNQEAAATDRVTLMSLHAAKGLEFNVVFLVGMEEGLFPHSRALLEKEQMEEERRLCYVGITRARRQLFLSSAQRRLVHGSYQSQLPARFLKEIPTDILQYDRSHELSTPNGSRPAKPAAKTWSDTDWHDPSLDKLLSGELSVDRWLDL